MKVTFNTSWELYWAEVRFHNAVKEVQENWDIENGPRSKVLFQSHFQAKVAHRKEVKRLLKNDKNWRTAMRMRGERIRFTRIDPAWFQYRYA